MTHDTRTDVAPDSQDSKVSSPLPADAAYHYIGDMLVELCAIAEQAKLKDLAALLRLSVAAVEANRRAR